MVDDGFGDAGYQQLLPEQISLPRIFYPISTAGCHCGDGGAAHVSDWMGQTATYEVVGAVDGRPVVFAVLHRHGRIVDL